MRVSNCLLNFAWTCSLCTIAIQTISCAIPGWLVLEVEADGVYRLESYAVWYIIICTHNSTHSNPCVTHSYASLRSYFEQLRSEEGSDGDPLNIEHSPKFTSNTITQWEMQVTFGLVCAIVAAGVLLRLRQRNKTSVDTRCRENEEPSAVLHGTVAVFIGLSCILYIMSVVRMGRVHSTLTSIAPLTKTKTGIPYGLIAAAMGTLTAFTTTASIGVMFYKVGCRCYRQGAAPNGDHCQIHVMPMLPTQGEARPKTGYASPLPPQYVGYQLPPENGLHVDEEHF